MVNIFKSIFSKKDENNKDLGPSTYYYRPERIRVKNGNDRTIIASIYNRISLDCSAININHIYCDDNGHFKQIKKSHLNDCLSLNANIDQTGRAFIQDAIMSMLDEGCVALVPIETTYDYTNSSSYDIDNIRVGKIIEWYPKHVKIDVYNDTLGEHQDIILPKEKVAIIENPFFAVMNEPNSTLKRLTRKLRLLDLVDEQTGTGKLDMIIQVPYLVSGERKVKEAEARRQKIEDQLKGSRYGVAYIDGTEKVIQLNRPLENRLLEQIDNLFKTLYSQLGMTEDILNGTADEKTMLNYYNRTIEPIMSVLVEELTRKFLTKTARSQNQKITYYRDPFKLVPLQQIIDMGEKFTRNEILSSNEVRQIIGMPPSEDPSAEQLRNKNLYPSEDPYANEQYPEDSYEEDPYANEQYPEDSYEENQYVDNSYT